MENNEINTEDEFKYIGVIFENKYSVGKRFSGRVYNYKTKLDLKEGQVIHVPTKYRRIFSSSKI